MLSQFEKKVAAFITSSCLFDSPEPVLLAVSGGADSVAMMFAMLRLTHTRTIDTTLVAGHINHKLRPKDADQDQEFVVGLGKKLGIKVAVRSINVRTCATDSKLSIETTARKLRRDALADIAKENGCKIVATAHHKDDNAETMVHRLLRGTGFRGLGGIWPRKDFANGITFVRPLLCVSRAEIIEYCRANHLQWRYDHTNADTGYTRNRIRHLLLPQLQTECEGSLAEQLDRLSLNCRVLYKRVCRNVEKVWPVVVPASQPDRFVLDSKVFCAQTRIIQAELIRRSLVAVGSGERDLKELHYRKIIELPQNPKGRTIELPDHFLAEYQHDKFIFRRISKPKKAPDPFLRPSRLAIPGRTQFGDYNIKATILNATDCDVHRFRADKDKNIEWFDYDKLIGPLLVRSRRVGDRFCPFGRAGQKRVGKFINAQKVPHRLRQKLLIIQDSEKIIWLAPLRRSKLAQVNDTTKTVLEIKIEKFQQEI
jgi:tRNA(Ile)-lysidine synthase